MTAAALLPSIVASLPEIIVVTGACILLIAGQFVPKERDAVLVWSSVVIVLLAALATFTLSGGAQPAYAGMFVADPLSAVGAMNEALRVGLRVPDDLSIIGFDDGDTRFLTHPRMTAVCQNTNEIGREAFAALHEMIEKPGTFEPLRERLPTRLEIHESTGRCNISEDSTSR